MWTIMGRKLEKSQGKQGNHPSPTPAEVGGWGEDSLVLEEEGRATVILRPRSFACPKGHLSHIHQDAYGEGWAVAQATVTHNSQASCFLAFESVADPVLSLACSKQPGRCPSMSFAGQMCVHWL